MAQKHNGFCGLELCWHWKALGLLVDIVALRLCDNAQINIKKGEKIKPKNKNGNTLLKNPKQKKQNF